MGRFGSENLCSIYVALFHRMVIFMLDVLNMFYFIWLDLFPHKDNVGY
jgi:hypothetical protein